MAQFIFYNSVFLSILIIARVSPQQRPQTSSNHTEHIKQVRRALATATPSPGVVKLPAGRRMPEPAVWKVAQQQLVMAVVMHETAAGMDMPNRRIRAQELRKWAEEVRCIMKCRLSVPFFAIAPIQNQAR